MIKIQRALVSVTDKTGIVAFCQALQALQVEIISTGGTAATLSDAGLRVIDVSDYTGFPEMLGGRVKTLHPKVHGGILGRLGLDDTAMAEHGIPPIDLVVVNLYPFEETIANPECSLTEAIENIDIGGPAMLRAAGKNHQRVAVVVDTADYGVVLAELNDQQGVLSDRLRFNLASKCFAHTARYDAAIAGYLARHKGETEPFPEILALTFERTQPLRYGENPHQRAAFYRELGAPPNGVVGAKQLQGKELSFNNIVDADTALACVRALGPEPACVIVKHANPCGVATAATLTEAYQSAYACDPVSAFGGIIAFNCSLDGETAEAILARQFVEVVVAPSVAAEALRALSAKVNVRVLEAGHWGARSQSGMLDYKRVAGGLLVQDADCLDISRNSFKVVSKREATASECDDLLFVWRVAKFVKSNAIVFGRGGRTLGIGAGQMSRVDSARLAGVKAHAAGFDIRGAVMASDAFFPFRDGIDAAAEAGIVAVIQPGGSVRDDEVIAAADEHGLAMIFTGVRHFRH